ncbi:MAG TPA: hypothetical protein VJ419_05735 [Gaiellaceae bacterium]|jgi:hypothetical protein|nr:hypothetical protein [Gaiellaceae bacterium]HUH20390.1 hypothetical protein [Gaiellaceae bacterium]
MRSPREIGQDIAQRDPSGGENRCKVREPSGVLREITPLGS